MKVAQQLFNLTLSLIFISHLFTNVQSAADEISTNLNTDTPSSTDSKDRIIFFEPNEYILEEGGEYTLVTTYCQYNATKPKGTSSIGFNFTGRCYCLRDYTDSSGDDCSIPGPTLIVYNGTTFKLNLVNEMTGANSNESWVNNMRDPDVTNFHTHGVHISSSQDNSLVVINPGEEYQYTLTIPYNHYPGTHWYHAHSHGSTHYQLTSGLFGAFIIKYNDEISNKIYDTNLLNLKQYVMHVHWVYTLSSNRCDCDNDTDIGLYSAGYMPIKPLCDQWCDMPQYQRDASGGQYDMTGEDLQEFFMINSQINPLISDSWYTGEYRVIRMINTITEFYLQMKFNNSNGCEYYLLGRDGIYFKDGHRNICDSPTNCYLILSQGSRADFAIKCDNPGIVEITTNVDDMYDWVSTLSRAGTQEEEVLFRILIESNDTVNTDDLITNLPDSYPEYPQYLQSLLDEDDVYKNCTCNSYNDSGLSFDNPLCGIQFQAIFGDDDQTFLVNNAEFDVTVPLWYLEANTVYEVLMIADRHPFHQHVSPFQLTEDVGNGVMAQKGDFMDTLGFTHNYTFRINTIDFVGIVVLHCHILQHEDKGMMTYYMILNESQHGQCPLNSTITVTEVSDDDGDEETEDNENIDEAMIITVLGIALVITVIIIIILVLFIFSHRQGGKMPVSQVDDEDSIDEAEHAKLTDEIQKV